MDCPILFDKQYFNALSVISDRLKERDYDTYIASTSFDSEEVWEMWYDSDEDIHTFIEYLNELEVEALCRMDEIEEEI